MCFVFSSCHEFLRIWFTICLSLEGVSLADDRREEDVRHSGAQSLEKLLQISAG